MNLSKMGISKKMFSTILLWSGYDGYYSISEIVKALNTNKNTVMSRVKRFRKKYPEVYRKILENRQVVKRATLRQNHTLSSSVSYHEGMDSHIRDTF